MWYYGLVKNPSGFRWSLAFGKKKMCSLGFFRKWPYDCLRDHWPECFNVMLWPHDILRISPARYSANTFMQAQKIFASVAAPSSSGPGRLVLIQKIAGSTPAGVTKENSSASAGLFSLVAFDRMRTCEAGAVERGRAQVLAPSTPERRRPLAAPAWVTKASIEMLQEVGAFLFLCLGVPSD